MHIKVCIHTEGNLLMEITMLSNIRQPFTTRPSSD